jgi:hypothetical protein
MDKKFLYYGNPPSNILENFANLGGISERLYIHFDDTTMTMLAALAPKLLGIKFMHQRHSGRKYRNILRACQGGAWEFPVVKILT